MGNLKCWFLDLKNKIKTAFQTIEAQIESINVASQPKKYTKSLFGCWN